MPTRNVVLTDQQAQFIEQQVRSGRYQNASEVLREGLRLVQAREQEALARQQAWQTAVVNVSLSEVDLQPSEINAPLSLKTSFPA